MSADDAGAPDAGAALPSLVEEAQTAWSRRDSDPGALDRAISLWEQAVLEGADSPETLLSAARARRVRLDRFVQDALEVTHAEVADAQACAAEAHRSWAAQFPQATGAFVQFVQIERPGAEALYLEAVCTSSWARMQGFSQLVARRTQLMGALMRVAELSPELDGAGPDRELGSLLAMLPGYAGGNLAEARSHFETAIRIAPQEPRNHLLLARTVAVKAQDRALFERELQLAVQSNEPGVSAQAAALLHRADDLFDAAEAAQPTPGGPQK
jgi:tetratricopeptide (TPR) repeat protein